MREETIDKIGKVVISQNNLYIIVQKNKLTLYVHPKATPPHYCLIGAADPIIYNMEKYQAYEPRKRFLRDCLHTAEEIMADTLLPLGQIHSQILTTKTPFGDTDTKNIQAVQAVADRNPEETDDMVAPAVKQAYLIARKTIAQANEHPYHAAAVVAIDGDDRITLEVFARGSDAKESERTAPGDFKMYSIAVKALTFHQQWTGDFGTDPITVALETR